MRGDTCQAALDSVVDTVAVQEVGKGRIGRVVGDHYHYSTEYHQ